MFPFKPKLNRKSKILAVELTREYFAKSDGDIVEFERLVRTDPRAMGISPAMIMLFIKVALMVFEYFRNRQVSGLPDVPETDIEIYANSLRYEE